LFRLISDKIVQADAAGLEAFTVVDTKSVTIGTAEASSGLTVVTTVMTRHTVRHGVARVATNKLHTFCLTQWYHGLLETAHLDKVVYATVASDTVAVLELDETSVEIVLLCTFSLATLLVQRWS
jgi:hypothetical protein